MKLALSLTDQSFTATKSIGIFNVSLGLAKGLMAHPRVEELHLIGNAECARAFPSLPPHVRMHESHRPVPQRFGRIWWDQIGLPAAVRKCAPDWALLPKGFPPFFPFLGRTRMACYVHDVIWEYYSRLASHGTCPFPRHELLYFRTLGKRALRQADLVLTSTRFNEQRFKAYAPRAHTAVVGIGFDTPQRRERPCGTDVLFYASPFPHKLTALGISRLRAWLGQRKDAAQIRIHVVGKLPEGISLPDERWIQHSRMPQEELLRLMSGQCRTSAYFSEYEGFGMPPIESLRAGIPCAASDIPPIRENMPEHFLFENSSEESFIRCMNEAYDLPACPDCPPFPTWEEVADRCICAMEAREQSLCRTGSCS